MSKMAIACNGDTPANIMPTLIMSSSGLAVDNEVVLFFCPAGARWLLKGELEKLGTPKGLPNPVDLFNENKDIDPKDLRDDRIKITKAPPFLMQVEDANLTFTF